MAWRWLREQRDYVEPFLRRYWRYFVYYCVGILVLALLSYAFYFVVERSHQS